MIHFVPTEGWIGSRIEVGFGWVVQERDQDDEGDTHGEQVCRAVLQTKSTNPDRE